MSKSYILYKDVAPGAAEAAEAASESSTDFSDASLLPKGQPSTPISVLEHNAWVLGGAHRVLSDQKPAFWSEELSGDDCIFENPPEITITFPAQYSSTGISLVGNTATGEYCTAVTIKWYQGGTLKEEQTFAPDAASYFCQCNVIYDKIVITLLKTNLPRRRAKLEQIIFGIHRYFYMDELSSVTMVNQTDLSSRSVPISTLSWTLVSKHDVDFVFQRKQPVESWNNSKLIGIYYISTHKDYDGDTYDINCNDAIGILDENPFPGGVYADKSAKALMMEIVGGDFALDMDEVADMPLTGVIASGSKRSAIQQVIFAWGVCLSTDGRNGLRLFSPGTEATEIGREKTFPGGSVESDSLVTEVRVTTHTYAEDPNGSVEIGGVKYSDTQTVYTVINPDVLANDKQNVVEITGATLVSPAIGQAVAQRVYENCARRDTNCNEFVWAGERLGDCVTQPAPRGLMRTGHLTKLTITLSNTVIAGGEALCLNQ